PGDHGGSAGPLRSGKVSTFEGGVRVPTVLWGPGHVPAGTTCDKIASTLDVLPTLASLAGAETPKDRIIDGEDITHLFHGKFDQANSDKAFYYYLRVHLQAVRQGKWKLHLPREVKQPGTEPFLVNQHIAPVDRLGFEKPFLVDLDKDIGETTNLAEYQPEVVQRLLDLAEGMRKDLGDFDQVGKNMRFFDPLDTRPTKPPLPPSRKSRPKKPTKLQPTQAKPTSRQSAKPPYQRPNLIIFMLDDVGYGDIGCFGGKRAATPHIDKMATEGMRMTDFYVHPVCGVTRASLLTGSYAMRVAEVGNRKNGHPILHPKEITIAEVMRDAGYRMGMVGKWHLAGSTRKEYPPELMPNAQGFDYFYGAPLHNGFTRTIEGSRFRMQLMRQNKVLDQSIDQSEMDQVTKLYTEEAVKFIKDSAKGDKPFMLYLAHTMAHVVIGTTDPFRGRSGGGLYGDVIEELDWSAGEVIKALKQAKVDDNTLMVFTSDNGPWIEQQLKGKGGNDAHYGTSGPLRGAKMMTWEGGVRVPTIVRWPGVVPAGKDCSEPATIMDLLPTFAKLGGGKIPDDRKIDGRDIMHLFRGDADAKSPHEAIYHYSYVHLQAVRSGKWKLVLPRPAKPKWTLWSARMIDAVKEVQLFDLQADIGETKNLAKEHPDVVGRLMKLIENAREDIGDYDRIGKGARFFDSEPKRSRSVFGRPAPVTPPVKNKPFAPLGDLRFDFESGDLQGWRLVEGAFSQPVSSALSLPRWQKDPFDRQGK
ncbi:MAG: sulfatase-like hydrolase/transferase, partial [Opitutales bacterium]